MKNTYKTNFNIFDSKISYFAAIFTLFFSHILPAQCPVETVAHYKLDEITGATTFVDFENNNDGSCVDGVNCPTPVEGLIGRAQEFNGENQFIDVPYSNDFDFAAGFTVMAWVKFTASADENKVIIGRTNNDSETGPGAQRMFWWLGISQNTNRATFAVRDNEQGAPSSVVEGTSALNDGQWHQIVGVHLKSGEKVRIYVDGVLQTSTDRTFTSDFSAPGKPLRIGNWRFSDESNNSNFFEGAIDNIGIFSRGLCDAGCVGNDEILALYNSGVAGTGICPTAPDITSTPLTTAAVAGTYSYQVEVTADPFPTFSLTTAPNGMSIDATTGLITWVPQQGDAGPVNVAVQATNGLGTDNQSFAITVEEENDPPSFDNAGDQTVDEDAGPQTVTDWATNIDDGDPELEQQVTFNITEITNEELFAVVPAISSTGELTYTTAENANGASTITVVLEDDGMPNLSSDPVQFTITVNPVNDPPAFTLAETEVTVSGNFQEVTVNAIPDPVPADEVDQTVIYTLSPESVSFAQISLSPTTGVLTINPSAAGGEGQQEFEVTANDNQSENNTFSQTFTLTVSGPTSLRDSEFAQSLSVFPIPGSDQVTLRMENDYVGAIQVKIFDMTGKTVKGFDAVKNTQQYLQEVDISDIESGTYFFYVVLDKDIVLEKLLIN